MRAAIITLLLQVVPPAEAACKEVKDSENDYPLQFKKLGELYIKLSKLRWATEKQIDQMRKPFYKWGRDGDLSVKVALARQIVKLADEVYDKARELERAYHAAYLASPPMGREVYRGLFESNLKEVLQLRRGTRGDVYHKIIGHRWSWESPDSDYLLNSMCFELFQGFCKSRDSERFLLSIADWELFITGFSQSVVEVIRKMPVK